jgi:hypothetical protein
MRNGGTRRHFFSETYRGDRLSAAVFACALYLRVLSGGQCVWTLRGELGTRFETFENFGAIGDSRSIEFAQFKAKAFKSYTQ